MKPAILAFCMMLAPAALMAQAPAVGKSVQPALAELPIPQAPSTATARGITLDEAYRLALAQSETLAQSAEGIKVLEATERQIRSLFLPSLTGVASETSAERSTDKGQAGVNLSYSLFNGMRDYITARSSGLKTGSARLALARAKQSLYLNVAQAYLNLSNVRQEIEVRQNQLAVTSNRLKELQQRESIGRTSKTDVLAAKTQLAQDDSSLQDAKGREDFAQVQLGFLTGLDVDLAPELLPVPQHLPRAAYMLKAQKRFDVEAARKTLEAARLDTDAAKHLRWPSVNLGADYLPRRSAPDQNINWDAGLSFSLPLFTGGFIGASIDQAKAQARSAELALALTARQAVSDVRGAYSVLHHSVATLNSLTNAAALAEDNFKLQSKDYTHSLVTNLDVLNAQNTLLQIKLSLEQARAQTCLAGVQLEVAAGGPDAVVEDK